MSLPRLSFLYPNLFKTAKSCETKLPRGSPYPWKPHRTRKSTFSTSVRKREETYPQRYGTAAEPLRPPPGTANSPGVTKTLANAIEKEVNAPNAAQNERKANSNETTSGGQEIRKSAEKVPESEELPAENLPRPSKIDGSDSHPREPVNPITKKDIGGKSLETVLQIETSAQKTEDHKPPHLQAPPYVHHFDTYTLVRDLQKGGFTEYQSVTLMKAVRSLLAINLNVAKEGLVSKSDIENETYLFRAACSELRTEILNTRKSSNSKMGTQRAHLQHEVDILSQKASQDSLALKDDFRGMLNDRKMAVRMQHQARDSKIQELNYKITVALNSDSKSEVEALRWTLARRAAMAIAGMAIFMLGFLRYSSYKLHERDEQRKLAASSSSSSDPFRQGSSAEAGSGGKNILTLREAGTQTGVAATAGVEGGDVSLG